VHGFHSEIARHARQGVATMVPSMFCMNSDLAHQDRRDAEILGLFHVCMEVLTTADHFKPQLWRVASELQNGRY